MVTQRAERAAKTPKFRVRGHEVTRIEAFSDVVFGFALTLLVVSLEVPHTFTELLADMRGFVPFAICFALLGHIWWMHHDFFRRYGLQDAVTASLNFALLFVILFYVYPLKFLFTGVLNQFTHHADVHDATGRPVPWIQNVQVPTLFVIYGLGYATLFGIFALLYVHAVKKKDELDLTQLELFDTYTRMMQSGWLATVGVLCSATAVLLPLNYSGLAGLVFCIIPLGFTFLGWWRGRGRRNLESAAAPPTGTHQEMAGGS